jgi:hypothetical protein
MDPLAPEPAATFLQLLDIAGCAALGLPHAPHSLCIVTAAWPATLLFATAVLAMYSLRSTSQPHVCCSFVCNPAAEVVTMSGAVLHVNATSHPDLFWALRGGGANYAIVTNWEFAVVPAPSNITYASLWWEPTAANLAAVLKAFTAWRPWLLQEEVARVHIGMCEYCTVHGCRLLWAHAFLDVCDCYICSSDISMQKPLCGGTPLSVAVTVQRTHASIASSIGIALPAWTKLQPNKAMSAC